MARNFVSASNQSLYVNAVPWDNTFPMTMCCWVRPVATMVNGIAFGMHYTGDTSAESARIQTRSGGAARAEHRDGTTAAVAETTALITAGSWHHVAAVFASTSSRTIYLDGANSVNNTTSATNTMNTDYLIVGRGRVSTGFTSPAYNGDISHCAIWNVALNAEEIAAIASGVCPTNIRPQNLIYYAPLEGVASPENNVWRAGGTYNLTLDNAPVHAGNPPKVMNMFF